MSFKPVTERIEADLEPLMERFFNNSKKDVEAMRLALADGDMETLRRMGHTAKGTGYGYGMRGMGDLGLALETAAQDCDVAGCEDVIKRMAHYLDTVVVEFRS